MNRIDLDEARQGRAEVDGQTTIVFKEREFTVPAELPAAVVFHAEEGYLGRAVRELLGDQFDDFMALSPSLTDIENLTNGFGAGGAKGLGRSAAS